MRPHGIVVELPGAEGMLERRQVHVPAIALPELLAERPVEVLDLAVELRTGGGRTNNWGHRAWQAASKAALNSLLPSTWIPLIGEGIRTWSAFRKAVAVPAVARLLSSTTPCREMTSTAVNWRRSTLGRGIRCQVST